MKWHALLPCRRFKSLCVLCYSFLISPDTMHNYASDSVCSSSLGPWMRIMTMCRIDSSWTLMDINVHKKSTVFFPPESFRFSAIYHLSINLAYAEWCKAVAFKAIYNVVQRLGEEGSKQIKSHLHCSVRAVRNRRAKCCGAAAKAVTLWCDVREGFTKKVTFSWVRKGKHEPIW